MPFTSERRYLECTNVLETTFHTDSGSARVIDSVDRPAGESAPGREVARRIEGLSGRVPFGWRVHPRFDYGQRAAQIDRRGDAYILSCGDQRLALQAWEAGELSVAHDAVGGTLTTDEGSSALISVSGFNAAPMLLSSRGAIERRLDGTVEYWRRWVGRSRYDGPWRAAVERSLLAIGLLTDERTGAIAAAGTTSLPEAIGRSRNYDYRYAWARDLSFTLDALLAIGFDDLAHKSFGWLLSATRHTHPRIDPIYRLSGVVLHGQSTLPLPGYRASTPVYLGNQATSQLQLGGFGDVLETAWLYARHGGVFDGETGERIADMADLLERLWRHADAGLWELGDDAQYLTSKMSAWVAFDRVLKLVHDGQVPARHVDRWRAARDEIRAYIEQQLWSERKRSYLMKAGSDALDAGCLLAARRGFVDADSERMNSTIDAIRKELAADGPLLYRYSGARDEENAFLACSFWLVEALAMAHRHDEAAETMEATLALANDVGLYSEEIDPDSKAMRGNFPQALTHLALINAAALFEEARKETSK